MIVIGFCGPAGAGKDTSADYLVEKYEFSKYSFTDILVDEARKRGLEPTKENLSKLGDELRKEGGMDVLARMLMEKIKGTAREDTKIVIANFRSPQEVEYTRKSINDFALILVDAPAEVRFSRLKTGETLQQFLARDERDTRLKGMDKVFEMADYKVDNSGDFRHLYSQLDKIMKTLGIV